MCLKPEQQHPPQKKEENIMVYQVTAKHSVTKQENPIMQSITASPDLSISQEGDTAPLPMPPQIQW